MERGTSAPILWNAASVDFGRITDVISRQQRDKALQIKFTLEDENVSTVGRRAPNRLFGTTPERKGFSADLSFTAYLRAGADGKTIYERFDLSVGPDQIRVDLRQTRPTISINGKRFEKVKFWNNIVTTSKQLFPFLLFESSPEGRVSEHPQTDAAIVECLRKMVQLPQQEPTAPTGAMRIRRNVGLIDVNASPPMPFVPRDRLIEVLREYGGIFSTLEGPNSSALSELGDLLLLTYASDLIEHVGGKITSAMENLSYLGPIRASGNRFYREQELSVDKIDDTGENLATYIGSLSAHELESFNSILFNSFGVEVRAHPEAGHISIEIGRPGDENYDNLADVGFGYSQVLPLIAQIHSESRRDRFPRPRDNQIQISAVEQPELHLHPAYQANLADLFVAAVDATEGRSKTPVIILETHSEALVGRIGELIALQKLAPTDVAVHFVDKDEATGSSTIRVAEFNDDGEILDWPVGFFSAR